MRKVMTERYDLAGNTVIRLGKVSLIGRVIPLGNMRGGPGARCLAILALLHYGGYYLYLLNARFGQRLQPFKRLLGRLRHRR